MAKANTKLTLQNAEEICRKAGVRFTEKRQRTLKLLLDANAPISAYEMKDQYEKDYGESLTAMSAYRMLNFLVEEKLAHKLHSVNKYAACEHINCDHRHEYLQFLICDSCQTVSEVVIDEMTLGRLKEGAAKTGFKLNEEQLELHGICGQCC